MWHTLVIKDVSGIEIFVHRLCSGDCVVVESAGNLWVNLFDAVEDKGVKAVLASPLKMKAIVLAKIRNDKVDAKVLAFRLGVGLWLNVMSSQKMLESLGLWLGIGCSLPDQPL